MTGLMRILFTPNATGSGHNLRPLLLADYREYHEIEALQRLERLGLPTCVGPAAQELAERIRGLLAGGGAADAARGYDALAPDGRGTDEAAGLLLNALSRPARSAVA
jgi:hypothetical protein